MVKGIAYLILALLIVGGLIVHWLGERGRELALIDRRLDLIGSPDLPVVTMRPIVAISMPDRLAP